MLFGFSNVFPPNRGRCIRIVSIWVFVIISIFGNLCTFVADYVRNSNFYLYMHISILYNANTVLKVVFEVTKYQLNYEFIAYLLYNAISLSTVLLEESKACLLHKRNVIKKVRYGI